VKKHNGEPGDSLLQCPRVRQPVLKPSEIFPIFIFTNFKNDMKTAILSFLFVLAWVGQSQILFSQNVGIGTAAPTEKIHILGNERLDGAFMPNNLPGTTGASLISQGPGVAPVWGPIINRWTTAPFTLNANTTYDITITGVTCTETSTVVVNLWGTWGVAPNVTVNYVESQINQVHFRVTNNTLFTTYTGMDFIIGIIR
jgi:hypothetical protein